MQSFGPDPLAPEIRVGGANSGSFAKLHTLSDSINSFCLVGDVVLCSVGGDIVVAGQHGIKRRHRGQPGKIMRTLRAEPSGAIWGAEIDTSSRTTSDRPLEPVFWLDPDVRIAGRGIRFHFRNRGHRFRLLFRRDRRFNHWRSGWGAGGSLPDIPRAAGTPTALAIDERLNVWLALADGWSVARLNAIGEIVRSIALPLPHPTGRAFCGDRMTELFVTSDRSRLNREQLSSAPLSGHLLSMDVG